MGEDNDAMITQDELEQLDPLDLIACVLPSAVSDAATVVGSGDELRRDLAVERSVWGAIDEAVAKGGHTLTRGGRICLRAAVLSDPLTRQAALEARQGALRGLESRWVARGAADGATQAELADLEGDVLWLLKVKSDEALSSVYDQVLFNSWMVGPLINRRSPMALLGLNVYRICVSPALGALTPLIYFIVPYIILYRKTQLSFGAFLKRIIASAVVAPASSSQSPFGVQLPGGVAMGVRSVSLLLSIVLYFHGVVSNVSTARMMYRIVSEIRRRMMRVRRFVDVATDRLHALWNEEDAFDAQFGPIHQASAPQLPPPSSDSKSAAWREQCAVSMSVPVSVSPCSKTSESPCYKTSAQCLHSYASIDITRLATSLLRRVYALDAAVGVLAAKRAMGMCWVSWAGRDAPATQGAAQGATTATTPQPPQPSQPPQPPQPFVRMLGLVHPSLVGSPGAVRNDVEIGGGRPAHVLLTGPNAGGKSTLMKSVLTAALLAQTLTVAPCSECTLTPFSRISSHINVGDTVGRESMFEAEMRRVLRVLKSPPTDGTFMLVALDELFSSTNPVEGVAAAVACVRRLASNAGVLSIVSTHFTRICSELERDMGDARGAANCRVAFYQMPVSRVPATATNKSTVAFPYVLRPGVCRQHIALELMAQRPGFDVALMLDAIRVKRRTLAPKAAAAPKAKAAAAPKAKAAAAPKAKAPEPTETAAATA
jgi:hypothetical protein